MRYLVQRPGFAEHSALPGAGRVVGVFRGEELDLAVPFNEMRHHGVTVWTPPFFTPFCGPLVAAGTSADESFWRDRLAALHKAIPGGAESAEIVFPPALNDVRGLVWKGWDARPHYNYVTEWGQPGGWESQPESAVRRQARKARDAGLEGRVAPAGQTADLQRLWRLNAERQGLPAGLAENLARLGTWLEAEHAGFQIVIAAKSGAAHAVGLFGFDESRVYYLAGASDPEHLGSGGATLLHFEAFAEIDRLGLPRCYDWVGANTPSVAQFKKKFRPRLELLLAARRTGKKTQLAQAARRLLRREES